ncbi:MAG: di-heme oxidoredictase family protein [Alcanivorax sp.]|uniref:di-heme oxidoreductase family protein n=1 Tax=Alcanivorax sp. TaxID=1872427 RepID=UPI00262FAD3E|nr:di-heme oxidoredictase family protein [Alcanivorax sp.]MDF1723168.1 di-heme oxidoredictase family protein [Alcanivorax sp.]
MRYLLLTLVTLLAACDQGPTFTEAEPGEHLSAGDATVTKTDQNAFSLPLANLSPSRRLDFSVGNSFFRNPWVIGPASTDARDGLGPLFNTNACQNCHIKDGRGHPPAADAKQAVSMLVRLSVPASETDDLTRSGLVPEPNYGGQFQDAAIPGIEPEGRVRVSYEPVTMTFADGHQVGLRKPRLEFFDLAYGEMHPATLFSARVAPPMIGLGLLEAIPEADLLAHADPNDDDGDGISGRANRVWDSANNTTAMGRFGWKAGQPGVLQQSAGAFANDMGLSSHLVSTDSCAPSQTDCLAMPNGGDVEVSDSVLNSVVFYSRTLAVPARRNVDDPQVLKGKALFHEANCQGCHVPKFTTGAQAPEPELANQTIRPYTDLLLHDMGPGLADGRPEFLANGQEWRTAPLWGIGLTEAVNGHTQFLHDGRARNLMEAVLWHGGEAAASRDKVLTFDADQRAALLAFLNSL